MAVGSHGSLLGGDNLYSLVCFQTTSPIAVGRFLTSLPGKTWFGVNVGAAERSRLVLFALTVSSRHSLPACCLCLLFSHCSALLLLEVQPMCASGPLF